MTVPKKISLDGEQHHSLQDIENKYLPFINLPSLQRFVMITQKPGHQDLCGGHELK